MPFIANWGAAAPPEAHVPQTYGHPALVHAQESVMLATVVPAVLFGILGGPRALRCARRRIPRSVGAGYGVPAAAALAPLAAISALGFGGAGGSMALMGALWGSVAIPIALARTGAAQLPARAWVVTALACFTALVTTLLVLSGLFGIGPPNG